jgi:hypothetical protein
MPKPGVVVLAVILAVSLAAAVAAPPPPARAQVPMGTAMACHDRAEIARQLGATYEEAPVSLGVQTNGNLLEVFASPRTGTWTIVSTAPDGEACVVAAGESWETLEAVAASGSAI